MAPSPGSSGAARVAVRIAIIHGQRMSGELLRGYCEGAWGCEVTTLESTGSEGLVSIERNQPDLMIVGHAPPALNCLEFLPAFKRSARSAKVLVTVPQLNDYLVHRLGALHLHAVVEEYSEGIAAVRTAIERVREGGRWLSPCFVQRAARLRADPAAFPKLLSGRQQAVLACTAQAMSDEEIGRTLGISVATAKRHRADTARKLNLRSTPRQLIRYGLEIGFASAPPPVRQMAAAV
ncbi:MAG: response regulator transcription factor [Opitutae bacterium]|nr:response regulator transcription factor [Opitutae bacterium]